MIRLLFVLALSLLAPIAGAQAENPVELGAVKWERDLDRALARSKSTGRDIFVLFQEVPG